MKINATITTKSGSWSQISKHVSRKIRHDSNKNIDKSKAHYNRHGYEINIRQTEIDHVNYDDWLNKYNAHVKGQGHSDRQKSVEQIIKGRKGSHPTNIAIATFGTMNDKLAMLDAINDRYRNQGRKQCEKRYYQACSWGLKHYAKTFNDRNRYLKLGHWYTNVDELGAPHLHYELLPLGRTAKNGKPSFSMTSAVEREMGTSDRRTAMRKWNKQECNALTKSMGEVFSQRFQIEDFDHFELHHTGRKHSISMKTYKGTWSAIDSQTKSLASASASIGSHAYDQSLARSNYQYYSSAASHQADRYYDLYPKNDEMYSETVSMRVTRNSLSSTNTSLSSENDTLNSNYNDQQSVFNRLNYQMKHMQDYLKKKWERFKIRRLRKFHRFIADVIKVGDPQQVPTGRYINKFIIGKDFDSAIGHSYFRKYGGLWLHKANDKDNYYWLGDKKGASYMVTAKPLPLPKKQIDYEMRPANDDDYMRIANGSNTANNGLTGLSEFKHAVHSNAENVAQATKTDQITPSPKNQKQDSDEDEL